MANPEGAPRVREYVKFYREVRKLDADAQKYLQKRNYQQALMTCEKVHTLTVDYFTYKRRQPRHVQHARCWIDLGNVYMSMEQYKRAEGAYNSALAICEDNIKMGPLSPRAEDREELPAGVRPPRPFVQGEDYITALGAVAYCNYNTARSLPKYSIEQSERLNAAAQAYQMQFKNSKGAHQIEPLVNLGGVLGKLNRYGDAVTALTHAYELAGKYPKSTPPREDIKKTLLHARKLEALIQRSRAQTAIYCCIKRWIKRRRAPGYVPRNVKQEDLSIAKAQFSVDEEAERRVRGWRAKPSPPATPVTADAQPKTAAETAFADAVLGLQQAHAEGAADIRSAEKVVRADVAEVYAAETEGVRARDEACGAALADDHAAARTAEEAREAEARGELVRWGTTVWRTLALQSVEEGEALARCMIDIDRTAYVDTRGAAALSEREAIARGAAGADCMAVWLAEVEARDALLRAPMVQEEFAAVVAMALAACGVREEVARRDFEREENATRGRQIIVEARLARADIKAAAKDAAEAAKRRQEQLAPFAELSVETSGATPKMEAPRRGMSPSPKSRSPKATPRGSSRGSSRGGGGSRPVSPSAAKPATPRIGGFVDGREAKRQELSMFSKNTKEQYPHLFETCSNSPTSNGQASPSALYSVPFAFGIPNRKSRQIEAQEKKDRYALKGREEAGREGVLEAMAQDVLYLARRREMARWVQALYRGVAVRFDARKRVLAVEAQREAKRVADEEDIAREGLAHEKSDDHAVAAVREQQRLREFSASVRLQSFHRGNMGRKEATTRRKEQERRGLGENESLQRDALATAEGNAHHDLARDALASRQRVEIHDFEGDEAIARSLVLNEEHYVALSVLAEGSDARADAERDLAQRLFVEAHARKVIVDEEIAARDTIAYAEAPAFTDILAQEAEENAPHAEQRERERIAAIKIQAVHRGALGRTKAERRAKANTLHGRVGDSMQRRFVEAKLKEAFPGGKQVDLEREREQERERKLAGFMTADWAAAARRAEEIAEEGAREALVAEEANIRQERIVDAAKLDKKIQEVNMIQRLRGDELVRQQGITAAKARFKMLHHAATRIQSLYRGNQGREIGRLYYAHAKCIETEETEAKVRPVIAADEVAAREVLRRLAAEDSVASADKEATRLASEERVRAEHRRLARLRMELDETQSRTKVVDVEDAARLFIANRKAKDLAIAEGRLVVRTTEEAVALLRDLAEEESDGRRVIIDQVVVAIRALQAAEEASYDEVRTRERARDAGDGLHQIMSEKALRKAEREAHKQAEREERQQKAEEARKRKTELQVLKSAAVVIQALHRGNRTRRAAIELLERSKKPSAEESIRRVERASSASSKKKSPDKEKKRGTSAGKKSRPTTAEAAVAPRAVEEEEDTKAEPSAHAATSPSPSPNANDDMIHLVDDETAARGGILGVERATFHGLQHAASCEARVTAARVEAREEEERAAEAAREGVAATKIQSIVRGSSERRRVNGLKSTQREEREAFAEEESAARAAVDAEQAVARGDIETEAAASRDSAALAAEARTAKREAEARGAAATRIQAVYRGGAARQQTAVLRERRAAELAELAEPVGPGGESAPAMVWQTYGDGKETAEVEEEAGTTADDTPEAPDGTPTKVPGELNKDGREESDRNRPPPMVWQEYGDKPSPPATDATTSPAEGESAERDAAAVGVDAPQQLAPAAAVDNTSPPAADEPAAAAQDTPQATGEAAPEMVWQEYGEKERPKEEGEVESEDAPAPAPPAAPEEQKNGGVPVDVAVKQDEDAAAEEPAEAPETAPAPADAVDSDPAPAMVWQEYGDKHQEGGSTAQPGAALADADAHAHADAPAPAATGAVSEKAEAGEHDGVGDVPAPPAADAGEPADETSTNAEGVSSDRPPAMVWQEYGDKPQSQPPATEGGEEEAGAQKQDVKAEATDEPGAGTDASAAPATTVEKPATGGTRPEEDVDEKPPAMVWQGYGDTPQSQPRAVDGGEGEAAKQGEADPREHVQHGATKGGQEDPAAGADADASAAPATGDEVGEPAKEGATPAEEGAEQETPAVVGQESGDKPQPPATDGRNDAAEGGKQLATEEEPPPEPAAIAAEDNAAPAADAPATNAGAEVAKDDAASPAKQPEQVATCGTKSEDATAPSADGTSPPAADEPAAAAQDTPQATGEAAPEMVWQEYGEKERPKEEGEVESEGAPAPAPPAAPEEQKKADDVVDSDMPAGEEKPGARAPTAAEEPLDDGVGAAATELSSISGGATTAEEYQQRPSVEAEGSGEKQLSLTTPASPFSRASEGLFSLPIGGEVSEAERAEAEGARQLALVKHSSFRQSPWAGDRPDSPRFVDDTGADDTEAIAAMREARERAEEQRKDHEKERQERLAVVRAEREAKRRAQEEAEARRIQARKDYVARKEEEAAIKQQSVQKQALYTAKLHETAVSAALRQEAEEQAMDQAWREARERSEERAAAEAEQQASFKRANSDLQKGEAQARVKVRREEKTVRTATKEKEEEVFKEMFAEQVGRQERMAERMRLREAYARRDRSASASPPPAGRSPMSEPTATPTVSPASHAAAADGDRELRMARRAKYAAYKQRTSPSPSPAPQRPDAGGSPSRARVDPAAIAVLLHTALLGPDAPDTKAAVAAVNAVASDAQWAAVEAAFAHRCATPKSLPQVLAGELSAAGYAECREVLAGRGVVLTDASQEPTSPAAGAPETAQQQQQRDDAEEVETEEDGAGRADRAHAQSIADALLDVITAPDAEMATDTPQRVIAQLSRVETAGQYDLLRDTFERAAAGRRDGGVSPSTADVLNSCGSLDALFHAAFMPSAAVARCITILSAAGVVYTPDDLARYLGMARGSASPELLYAVLAAMPSQDAWDAMAARVCAAATIKAPGDTVADAIATWFASDEAPGVVAGAEGVMEELGLQLVGLDAVTHAVREVVQTHDAGSASAGRTAERLVTLFARMADEEEWARVQGGCATAGGAPLTARVQAVLSSAELEECKTVLRRRNICFEYFPPADLAERLFRATRCEAAGGGAGDEVIAVLSAIDNAAQWGEVKQSYQTAHAGDLLGALAHALPPAALAKAWTVLAARGVAPSSQAIAGMLHDVLQEDAAPLAGGAAAAEEEEDINAATVEALVNLIQCDPQWAAVATAFARLDGGADADDQPAAILVAALEARLSPAATRRCWRALTERGVQPSARAVALQLHDALYPRDLAEDGNNTSYDGPAVHRAVACVDDAEEWRQVATTYATIFPGRPLADIVEEKLSHDDQVLFWKMLGGRGVAPSSRAIAMGLYHALAERDDGAARGHLRTIESPAQWARVRDIYQSLYDADVVVAMESALTPAGLDAAWAVLRAVGVKRTLTASRQLADDVNRALTGAMVVDIPVLHGVLQSIRDTEQLDEVAEYFASWANGGDLLGTMEKVLTPAQLAACWGVLAANDVPKPAGSIARAVHAARCDPQGVIAELAHVSTQTSWNAVQEAYLTAVQQADPPLTLFESLEANLTPSAVREVHETLVSKGITFVPKALWVASQLHQVVAKASDVDIVAVIDTISKPREWREVEAAYLERYAKAKRGPKGAKVFVKIIKLGLPLATRVSVVDGLRAKGIDAEVPTPKQVAEALCGAVAGHVPSQDDELVVFETLKEVDTEEEWVAVQGAFNEACGEDVILSLEALATPALWKCHQLLLKSGVAPSARSIAEMLRRATEGRVGAGTNTHGVSTSADANLIRAQFALIPTDALWDDVQRAFSKLSAAGARVHDTLDAMLSPAEVAACLGVLTSQGVTIAPQPLTAIVSRVVAGAAGMPAPTEDRPATQAVDTGAMPSPRLITRAETTVTVDAATIHAIAALLATPAQWDEVARLFKKAYDVHLLVVLEQNLSTRDMEALWAGLAGIGVPLTSRTTAGMLHKATEMVDLDDADRRGRVDIRQVHTEFARIDSTAGWDDVQHVYARWYTRDLVAVLEHGADLTDLMECYAALYARGVGTSPRCLAGILHKAVHDGPRVNKDVVLKQLVLIDGKPLWDATQRAYDTAFGRPLLDVFVEIFTTRELLEAWRVMGVAGHVAPSAKATAALFHKALANIDDEVDEVFRILQHVPHPESWRGVQTAYRSEYKQEVVKALQRALPYDAFGRLWGELWAKGVAPPSDLIASLFHQALIADGGGVHRGQVLSAASMELLTSQVALIQGVNHWVDVQDAYVSTYTAGLLPRVEASLHAEQLSDMWESLAAKGVSPSAGSVAVIIVKAAADVMLQRATSGAETLRPGALPMPPAGARAAAVARAPGLALIMQQLQSVRNEEEWNDTVAAFEARYGKDLCRVLDTALTPEDAVACDTLLADKGIPYRSPTQDIAWAFYRSVRSVDNRDHVNPEQVFEAIVEVKSQEMWKAVQRVYRVAYDDDLVGRLEKLLTPHDLERCTGLIEQREVRLMSPVWDIAKAMGHALDAARDGPGDAHGDAVCGVLDAITTPPQWEELRAACRAAGHGDIEARLELLFSPAEYGRVWQGLMTHGIAPTAAHLAASFNAYTLDGSGRLTEAVVMDRINLVRSKALWNEVCARFTELAHGEDLPGYLERTLGLEAVDRCRIALKANSGGGARMWPVAEHVAENLVAATVKVTPADVDADKILQQLRLLRSVCGWAEVRDAYKSLAARDLLRTVETLLTPGECAACWDVLEHAGLPRSTASMSIAAGVADALPEPPPAADDAPPPRAAPQALHDALSRVESSAEWEETKALYDSVNSRDLMRDVEARVSEDDAAALWGSIEVKGIALTTHSRATAEKLFAALTTPASDTDAGADLAAVQRVLGGVSTTGEWWEVQNAFKSAFKKDPLRLLETAVLPDQLESALDVLRGRRVVVAPSARTLALQLYKATTPHETASPQTVLSLLQTMASCILWRETQRYFTARHNRDLLKALEQALGQQQLERCWQILRQQGVRVTTGGDGIAARIYNIIRPTSASAPAKPVDVRALYNVFTTVKSDTTWSEVRESYYSRHARDLLDRIDECLHEAEVGRADEIFAGNCVTFSTARLLAGVQEPEGRAAVIENEASEFQTIATAGRAERAVLDRAAASQNGLANHVLEETTQRDLIEADELDALMRYTEAFADGKAYAEWGARTRLDDQRSRDAFGRVEAYEREGIHDSEHAVCVAMRKKWLHEEWAMRHTLETDEVLHYCDVVAEEDRVWTALFECMEHAGIMVAFAIEGAAVTSDVHSHERSLMTRAEGDARERVDLEERSKRRLIRCEYEEVMGAQRAAETQRAVEEAAAAVARAKDIADAVQENKLDYPTFAGQPRITRWERERREIVHAGLLAELRDVERGEVRRVVEREVHARMILVKDELDARSALVIERKQTGNLLHETLERRARAEADRAAQEAALVESRRAAVEQQTRLEEAERRELLTAQQEADAEAAQRVKDFERWMRIEQAAAARVRDDNRRLEDIKAQSSIPVEFGHTFPPMGGARGGAGLGPRPAQPYAPHAWQSKSRGATPLAQTMTSEPRALLPGFVWLRKETQAFVTHREAEGKSPPRLRPEPLHGLEAVETPEQPLQQLLRDLPPVQRTRTPRKPGVDGRTDSPRTVSLGSLSDTTPLCGRMRPSISGSGVTGGVGATPHGGSVAEGSSQGLPSRPTTSQSSNASSRRGGKLPTMAL